VDPLSTRITKVTFRLGLRGYKVDDVDRCLSLLADRLEKGESVSPTELTAIKFRRALKGYNVDEVDGFVGEIAAQLGSR
jgi:DivIVA domain-containing protein